MWLLMNMTKKYGWRESEQDVVLKTIRRMSIMLKIVCVTQFIQNMAVRYAELMEICVHNMWGVKGTDFVNFHEGTLIC